MDTKLEFARQGGRQATSSRRLSTSAESFGASRSDREGAKVGEVHSSRRMRARASLKVAACFGYQRTHSGRRRCPAWSCVAHGVTSENKSSSAGLQPAPRAVPPGDRFAIVRRMARSDHCRCVSTPRWRRASSKVVSTRQRRTNQRRMSTGSAVRSVHRNACGSFSPLGSRTSTQRIATRMPGWCHGAVPEAMSSLRSVRPYQPSMLTLRQRVAGFSSRCFRVGSRPPLTGGRPTAPGLRGGAGL